MRRPDIDLGWRDGAPKLLLRKRYACAACGAEYRPVVQPHSLRWLLLVPVAGLVVLVLLWLQANPDWVRPLALLLVAALVVLAVLAPRLLELDERPELRERPVFKGDSGLPPRPGEILLECPSCGSSKARPAGARADGGGGLGS